jgi:hypothetical protein
MDTNMRQNRYHSILPNSAVAGVLGLLLMGLLGSVGCEGNLGSAESTGGDDGNVIEMPCSSSKPCPDGQFCFNGLCALGCNSDADCAENQYCDTSFDFLCHNNEVPTCNDDDDCAEGQICSGGLCSTPPEDTSCNPDGVFLGDDGCASNALCLSDDQGAQEVNACYTFPACAADDTCPTGTMGAVCNVDLIPNKDRICLVGLCEGAGDCPSDWACVKPENHVLGMCSPGGAGTACLDDSHCASGTCIQPIPGQFGYCG